MPLKDINEYLETTFSPKSRPAYRTVLDQIKNNRLPFYHIKIGRDWFIDPDRTIEEENIQEQANELMRMVEQ